MGTIARLLRFLLVVVAMLWTQAANATFHLFIITEIYSNASGNVQYIVLQTTFGFQQFLTGHQITATSQGGDSHIYTFPSDLPEDSANRSFLIGTEGFASLGIVAPDYIVPNGFLFPSGGTINYAGVDIVVHGALPGDGIHAIDRNGGIVATAPTNFAFATGAIVDCMFNWGERNFPQFFAPAGAISAKFPPYYFRYYPGTATYLATSSADDHIWVQSPVLTENVPEDIAPIASFLAPSGCSP
ncbi:MAG TPA: hypothetical protein VN663_13395 [Ramlibacter sp.]|nr:hypothetical protein [Ramlibacter sp.]